MEIQIFALAVTIITIIVKTTKLQIKNLLLFAPLFLVLAVYVYQPSDYLTVLFVFLLMTSIFINNKLHKVKSVPNKKYRLTAASIPCAIIVLSIFFVYFNDLTSSTSKLCMGFLALMIFCYCLIGYKRMWKFVILPRPDKVGAGRSTVLSEVTFWISSDNVLIPHIEYTSNLKRTYSEIISICKHIILTSNSNITIELKSPLLTSNLINILKKKLDKSLASESKRSLNEYTISLIGEEKPSISDKFAYLTRYGINSRFRYFYQLSTKNWLKARMEISPKKSI